MTRRRWLSVPVSLALAASAVTLTQVTAEAVSPDIVISEVYGGGGNFGAQYSNDFIELYNRGATTVDLSGWSVQYASASGSSWAVTTLGSDIAPGEHYLVKEAAGATPSQDLPTPDASGSIAMAGTSGKVALVTSTTGLTCGADCDTFAAVRDFVGYGSANDFETAAAPGLSNTTSDSRNASGDDADNNATDFTAGAPAPQNRNRPPTTTTVMEIQGADHTSTLAGQSVTGVPGIVTAVASSGFYLQDATGDDDPQTSDAVFVYTASAPTTAVGDSVRVAGTVTEFRAGGATSDNLTTTEISTPTVATVATGQPLPDSTTVGAGSVASDRTVPSTVIEDDSFATFDPANDGIDFWESLEAMRVEVDDAQVVGPTSKFDETPIVPAGATTRTSRGGIVVTANDFNPERILIDNPLATVEPSNVGDSFAAVIGVVDYSFSNFKLFATESPVRTNGALTKETAAPAPADQLSAASFNVENLDPTDPQTKFDDLAAIIVDNLAAPDLLALEEVQDNTGATNDETVADDQTIAKLVASIDAAGGPAYSWTSVNPENNQDGGEPGGNIRVGFLYRTDRGLALVERDPGDATTPTAVTTDNGQVALSHSPGRVDPNNPAWESTRKPVAAQFTWNGRTVFAIANHFSSKGGDDPLFGRTQPPVRSSEAKRHEQAQSVRTFVDGLLAAAPQARVLVLGDLNDFEFSETTDILVGSGATALTDLPRTLPAAERYSYVYEGNSQVLDHILVSPQLATDGYTYDVVHVNAEFANQTSDHDPQLLNLSIPAPNVTSLTLAASPTSRTYLDGTSVTLSGTLSNGTSDDLSDHQVTLEEMPAGSTQWSDVSTKAVAADGTYSFSVQPERNTGYRVSYRGPRDAASTSEPVGVDVRAKVTIHPSAERVKRREPVTFSGQVAPNKAGDPVTLQLLVSGGWRDVATDTLDTYSEYALSYAASSKGSYTVRVAWGGDSAHVASVSDPRTITVK